MAAEPLVPVVQPTYFGGKAKDSCIQVPLAQVHHAHKVNGPEELLGLEQHIQSAQNLPTILHTVDSATLRFCTVFLME